eukprot:Skav231745  [mRNA]  locus=scaffold1584:201973:207478:+ [translate_table: standard]
MLRSMTVRLWRIDRSYPSDSTSAFPSEFVLGLLSVASCSLCIKGAPMTFDSYARERHSQGTTALQARAICLLQGFTGQQSISALGFVWAAAAWKNWERVAAAATWLLPRELDKKSGTLPEEAAESESLSMAQAVQRIPVPLREALVWAAVLLLAATETGGDITGRGARFAAERSFSIGAIEVATALLLEVPSAEPS